MTQLIFNDLNQFLPDNTITWAGFGAPLMLNFNNLSDDDVTPESSLVEGTGKLLNALQMLVNKVNSERVLAGHPPIAFMTRTIVASEDGNPIYKWTTSIEVDASAALNNAVDPTA